MGADAQSVAVLGFKVPRVLAIEIRTVRAFEHEYPEHYKLDPVTGRELWCHRDFARAPFENGDEGICLGRFAVIESGPYEKRNDSVFVAAVVARSPCSPNVWWGGLHVKAGDEVRVTELFALIAQHPELAEKAVFGLWAITEWSY
jgi:hypothetical protein